MPLLIIDIIWQPYQILFHYKIKKSNKSKHGLIDKNRHIPILREWKLTVSSPSVSATLSARFFNMRGPPSLATSTTGVATPPPPPQTRPSHLLCGDLHTDKQPVELSLPLSLSLSRISMSFLVRGWFLCDIYILYVFCLYAGRTGRVVLADTLPETVLFVSIDCFFLDICLTIFFLKG